MATDDLAELLRYHERVRARTLRVAQCIPPEHLEWTFRPGRFTLGDLLRHLGALERYMFAETAAGRPSRYPGHGRELADGHDAVFAFFDRTHREAMAILAGLSPEQVAAPCTTPDGARLPVWKWLRSMTEHEIHHRGQIYLYLAMLDVPTPPLYGLTSEEVRGRSQPLS